MKRIFLLSIILFFSVLSTACVNNLAIQELNNQAQDFMNKGDTDSAICRLESSLALDENVFETRYNLGIAYLTAQKYEKAIETLNKALEINPSYTDIYYSIAVATDELNYIEIEKIKNSQPDTDTNDVISEEKTLVVDEDRPLTEEEKTKITEKVYESIAAYEKYLDLSPNAVEKESIADRIKALNAMLDFDKVTQ